MATAAVEAPPSVTKEMANLENSESAVVSTWPTPGNAPHPQAAEIIRQVEHYFGEDNLCYDAHLLGLFKEGKGWVSFNEITGFKAMRKYKPKMAVREALRQSRLVVVSEDGKRLSRKYKLSKPIMVIPKINRDRQKTVIPEDKPWLTKAMLKPTGFESHATNGPIKPEEYEEDRNEYNLDNSFSYRIEVAMNRFCARRKMHEKTRTIFTKFMLFGGMDAGQHQFTGGLDEKSMEGYTKKELAILSSGFGISESVKDGLEEDNLDGKGIWRVDFVTVTKAFFSSHFVHCLDWHDDNELVTATNVVSNFYNYLLSHDVCPEYSNEVILARTACDQAKEELRKLKEVDSRLPGGFNVACSTLFGGNYSNLHAAGGDWVKEDDNMGWSREDAERVFLTGIFAHGTEAQISKLEDVNATAEPLSKTLKVIEIQENLGLEIVSVESPGGEAMDVYNDPKLAGTLVRPMGKLRCVRWNVPHAAPLDLPRAVVEARFATSSEVLEFLVDDDILRFCVPGMKIECCVKELDVGIKWIDYVDATYASFFTWLSNERIREWKEPGPPTRGIGSENGDVVSKAQVKDAVDAVDDDDIPD